MPKLFGMIVGVIALALALTAIIKMATSTAPTPSVSPQTITQDINSDLKVIELTSPHGVRCFLLTNNRGNPMDYKMSCLNDDAPMDEEMP